MRVTVSPAPANTDARDRLVMAHLPLVKVLAQRLAQRLPSQVEFNELVSVGAFASLNRRRPMCGSINEQRRNQRL